MCLDDYWANYDRCLDRIKTDASTADELIAIVNQHFTPSVADAFLPGGDDRGLLSTRCDTPGWSTVWVNADYHFAARDRDGHGITYVEGDIYRGVQQQ